MTKQEFWALCNDNDKAFLKELAIKFSAHYEPEEIGQGVVIQDRNPEQPYQCWWKQ